MNKRDAAAQKPKAQKPQTKEEYIQQLAQKDPQAVAQLLREFLKKQSGQ